MTQYPPPAAPPFGSPPGWNAGPGVPPKRRGISVKIVVGVLVVALVAVLVPVLVLWAYTRGAVRASAADLPDDLCVTVREAIGDPAREASMNRVVNELEDRSYASCSGAITTGATLGYVTVDVTRMGSTSFAGARSRALDLTSTFCAGAGVGDLASGARGGLTALQGSTTCVASTEKENGSVLVAIAGSPAGHDDTFVGVVAQTSGEDASESDSLALAQKVARAIATRL